MSVILNWIDYVSLGCYFLLVIGFGIWTFIPKTNRESVSGYFLAGRSMHFIPVGASLFASNIGSGHLIGLAGGGAASGVGIAGFETTAPIILAALGWIFLPVYIRAGVYTMPEYLQKRFGGDRIRVCLSILSLVLYISTKISADLFSGALFIKITFNLDLYISIGVLLIIAAFFSIGGGLAAVIWTDFIQTVIMVIGALYLMIKSFIDVGGLSSLRAKYAYSVPKTTLFSNSTCGLPPNNYFNMIRNLQSDYPWPGMIFGVLINSIWYWCSDQVIVQRALAAKNLTHAKLGCVMASLLKFTPLFLIILPGMVARVYFTDEVACADPVECMKYCDSEIGCSNLAYPRMVLGMMPSGARGLMLAMMMSALMSSLTSIFNSSSAIFTMDIWKRLRTNAKEWELMVVSRLTVVVLVIISIMWIPIIQASQGSRLFDYIQSTLSYLSPPISAIYIMAVLYERLNEKGAFWGLICGIAVGLIRSAIEFSYKNYPCAKKYLDTKPAIISKVHYLHFRIISFFLTIFVSWLISILTEPIPKKYLQRLTYFTINSPNEPIQIPSDKGACGNGFCTGAKLSEDEDENEETIEMSVKGEVVETDSSLENVVSIEKNAPRNSRLVRLFFCICGVSLDNKNNSKKFKPTVLNTSIDEDPFWSRICDIGVSVAIAAAGFLFAFFNDYNN